METRDRSSATRPEGTARDGSWRHIKRYAGVDPRCGIGEVDTIRSTETRRKNSSEATEGVTSILAHSVEVDRKHKRLRCVDCRRKSPRLIIRGKAETVRQPPRRCSATSERPVIAAAADVRNNRACAFQE